MKTPEKYTVTENMSNNERFRGIRVKITQKVVKNPNLRHLKSPSKSTTSPSSAMSPVSSSSLSRSWSKCPLPVKYLTNRCGMKKFQRPWEWVSSFFSIFFAFEKLKKPKKW